MHDALTTTTGFTEEALQALSAAKAEPAWMLEKRLLGWRIYGELPMPFWRRTDLSGLKLDDLTPYNAPTVTGGPFSGVPADMRLAEDERWSAGVVLQRDSGVVYSTLAKDLAAKGVIVTDLDTAVQKHPELVKRYMMTNLVAPGEDRFTALHAAFWSGGIFVYVPKNVEVALPIMSLNWIDTAGLAQFTHSLVVAEEGSSLSILEEFGSLPSNDKQLFHSGIVEVFAGRGADVTYADVQNLGRAAYSITSKKSSLQHDASMRWVSAHLGGKLTHARVQTALSEPGANMKMMGIYLAGDRQRLEIDSLTDHIAPHTTADVLYRGIIRDRAHTVFQGLIKVQEQAQQTDSYLANHNLLLSPRARADSIPTLEIEANDVRCTHGATIGQIDEEQLFYMRCRGLSRVEAERLIIAGFVQPVLDRVPEGAVRARVTAAVHAKLGATA